MAIKMIFDPARNIQSPTMVLAYKSGKSIGAILPYNIHYAESLNAYNEFSFDVYKELDGVECKYWSKITDFKLIYCVEWDAYFEIYVELDESDKTIKHIQGRALSEAELSQIKVYGLEVNTELDISRDDYEPTVIYNYNENISLIHKLLEKTPNFTIGHVDISIAKLQRTFTFDDKTVYDALQEVAKEVNCLIEFIAKKGENGQIERIINIYDLQPYCRECGCRDISTDAIGDICSEYHNSESAHANYKGRGIDYGYGEDTTIFISTQNLAENITYSSDADSVKNCFKLTAGDDLMTATVRSCSPSKSGYLWHFTEETKADMSKELRDALSQYQAAYNQYNTEFKTGDVDYGLLWTALRSQYNNICTKYGKNTSEDDYTAPLAFKNFSDMMNLYYDTVDLELYLRSGMMPSTSVGNTNASEEIRNISSLLNISLQSINGLSVYSANNAIESHLKSVVDSRFQIKLNNSSFAGSVWTGSVTITLYSNEEESATKNITAYFNDDAEGYAKQKIENSLAKEKAETPDVIALFDTDGDYKTESTFKAQIAKYGLVPLIRLRDAGQACLNLMIEMGIASGKSSTLWLDKWINAEENSNKDLYNNLYLPYYNRVGWLDEEIEERQEEIDTIVGKFDKNGNLLVDGMMSYLEKMISKLQEKLDLEGYITSNCGDSATELLKELVSFRREDTYQNDNFISEGLDNAQIFARALEFVAEAEKDIRAAAIPVHTISATLKNLLVMEEFKALVDNFKLGNWIRLGIDDDVYKLRLIKYEIAFDSIDDIIVEFSDVQAVKDSTADIQSILNQASSIASNYSNIKIATSNNKKTGEYVWEWVNEGLALTKMKIVDDAENQNIYWDENGFLCREYSPIMDAYEDKQLKIINKGLYLTDDNWKTTRAGIGNFIYYNPKTSQYEESYGVIADTLVGNLILSKEVGIYNENNSVQIDSDGFVITTKAGTDVFRIRKDTGETERDENGKEVTKFTDLLFLDEDGDLHIKGHITATSLDLIGDSNLDLDVNLSDYLTKGEYSEFADDIIETVNGYNVTIGNIQTAIGKLESADVDQIKRLNDVNDNALFVATTYSDSGDGTVFAVSKKGLLTASNAVISGTVYATDGKFFGELYGQLMETYNNEDKYNFVVKDNCVYAGWDKESNRYNFMIDENGNVTIKGDVTLTGQNSKISWSDIDDIPGDLAYESDIPTTDQITTISQTAITTAYLNAKDITAKYVTAGYLKSNNYNYTSFNANSKVGTFIDLSTGYFNLGGKIIYNGSTLTLDTDLTISWNDIPDVPSNLAYKTDIPKNTSDLNNNSGYITSASVPTEAQITTISNKAIATAKISANQISAGIIQSANPTTTQAYNLYSQWDLSSGVMTFKKNNTTTNKILNLGCFKDHFYSADVYSDPAINFEYSVSSGKAGLVIHPNGDITSMGNYYGGIVSGSISDANKSVILKFYDDSTPKSGTAVCTIASTSTILYPSYFLTRIDKANVLTKDVNCVNAWIYDSVRLMSRGSDIILPSYTNYASNIYSGIKDSDGNYYIHPHVGDDSSGTRAGAIIFGNESKSVKTSSGTVSGYSEIVGGIVRVGTGNTEILSLNAAAVRFNGKNVNTSAWVSTSSDERIKSNISKLTDIHESYFNNLNPVSFKYINGTSDRTHYGFIAQQVRDAALGVGLTTQDIAMFVSTIDENDKQIYALRYDEFIALNTHMIQKCLKEIDSLKAKNQSLLEELSEIKQSISN